MFSKDLEYSIGQCYKRAREARHEYMTIEHLLLALLDNPTAESILKAIGADLARLRADLEQAIDQSVGKLDEDDGRDTQPTLGFQRVLQRAVYHVQASGNKEVTAANVLVAIFGEKDSHAVYFLNQQDINRLDVVNFLAEGVRKDPPPTPVERIEQIAEKRAPAAPLETAGTAPNLRVFISYSHKDAGCLERLLIHLKPLERTKKIDAWSDKQLQGGDKWRDAIAANIETAAVAILLLSADFLASDFIVNNELQPLLIKADTSGTRIIPVIVKPCGFLRDETLQNYQAINDPASPLLGMGEVDQERLYDKIAAAIHEEMLQRQKRPGARPGTAA